MVCNILLRLLCLSAYRHISPTSQTAHNLKPLSNLPPQILSPETANPHGRAPLLDLPRRHLCIPADSLQRACVQPSGQLLEHDRVVEQDLLVPGGLGRGIDSRDRPRCGSDGARDVRVEAVLLRRWGEGCGEGGIVDGVW
jgi:hypothetical protein